MIKIFAYDDNQERLQSLQALIMLSDNMVYIGEAYNCENVLTDVKTYLPDVVLMDINMPKVDGIQGLKTVSYTHLDVYKRQELMIINGFHFLEIT